MKLSVVIPTLRRPDALPRALAALERQTLDHEEFEIVVVRDPDDDDRDAVAQAVEGVRGVTARHLTADASGASAARNVGWRAAQAPLIMFTGDDILAAPDLLEQHLEWHAVRGGPRTAVLGHVRWATELRVTPFMRWLEHGVQFNYPAIEGDEANWHDFYTSNVSLPRALLEEIGGFDEDRFPFPYEDLDVGYRLRATRDGFTLLYNRRAVGDHLHATTVDGFKHRLERVAAAERQWVRRYPELPAYFHDRFAEAAAMPPARGRGRHLLRFVKRDSALGRRVWFSTDVYYRQQLAPAFLDAWDRHA